jgi:hypothetical protein
VGNGKMTSFWDDVWLSTVPLRICFPRIHDVCDDKKISVVACADMGWHLRLRRMLDTKAFQEWNQLQRMLVNILITDDVEDEISWELSPSRVYTTSSLYRLLTSQGRVPLKVRIFLWQALQDRLGCQLKSRNWRGSERCYLCNELEDADHLLFRCP